METDDSRWAWVTRAEAKGVYSPGDAGYDDLVEADVIVRWIEAGAPPVEPVAPLPTAPQPIDVPSVALAVSREQAATLLSVSVDTLERHIWADLRVIRVGARSLV